MGFVHERGILNTRKSERPKKPPKLQKPGGSKPPGFSHSALDDERSTEAFTKKGSLQRLPERSGEEIRTLDTAGMNRML